jgi:hypothetical protein
MPVRCYVQQFLNNGIKFFLQEFRSGATSVFLKDTTTLDNIYLPVIQAGTLTDVIMNLSTGVDNHGAGTLTDLFTAYTLNGRQNVYASGLIAHLATFYGVTLVNDPTNYHVFCNQWKSRSGDEFEFKFISSSSIIFLSTSREIIPIDTLAYNDYINSTGGHISCATKFNFYAAIQKVQLDIPTPSGTYYDVEFGLEKTTGEYLFIQNVSVSTVDSADNFALTLDNVPAGSWWLVVSVSNVVVHGRVFVEASTFKVFASINYTDLELVNPDFKYPDFTGDEYPCWQNLPKITAKTLFETIAVCAGKMIEYKDDTITFIDFADVFDPASAVDISDKLVSWKTKDFKFLSANNATVNYASGQVIATVIIDDETLPTDTNSVATIDAIRIQDDTATDRVTDKLVLAQTPTGSFEVISQLAELYAPLTSPKLFEAEFIYFADNKRPLLIRQLGGIFIALESIISTKTTITLKLLKIA